MTNRREAEKAAQERYNVPLDKAGRDYISRPMDKDKFDENFEKIDFSKVPNNLEVASRKGARTTYVYGKKKKEEAAEPSSS